MDVEQILYIDFGLHVKKNDYTLRPIIDLIRGIDKNIVIFGNPSEYRLGWYENYLNFEFNFNYNSNRYTSNPCEKDNLFHELEEVLKFKDAQFYLLVGSEYNSVFSNFSTHPIENFQVLYWPTFLLSHTFNNLRKEFSSSRIKKQFDHLFVTYNNKTRIHRKQLMDELCKRRLLENNLYSWIETGTFQHGSEHLGVYHMECFEDKKVMLDDFDYHIKREFTSNLLDMNCLFNIVSESDVQAMFITEKTYRQLVIGQPFLSLCAKDTHKTLYQYGFQLYDEIFDYSFDSQTNHMDRIKGIVDNVERYNNSNFEEIYKKIEDKVEFNVKKAHEIYDNSKFTPNLILELTKIFLPNKDSYTITDSVEMLSLLRQQMPWYLQ
jgi:hypothetical protein